MLTRFRLGLAMLSIALGALAAPASVAASTCWLPPVDAPVSDPFRAPRCPYCAGNRGIEYATAPGVPVRSVAAGRVSFSGMVAGTGYVVVELPSGRRLTYGNVVSALRVGDVAVAGSRIGLTAGPLHFGLRDGERYLDPTPFLGELRYRARLVPTDGSPGNDPGEPSLRCGQPDGVGRPVR